MHGSRRAVARRLASFAATVGASTFVSLVTVPVVIGRTDASSWGTLAVIQAGAVLFGVIVAFGWGTTGAAVVAATPAPERPRLYAESLASRAYLFVIALPLMIFALLAISPGHTEIVIAGSLAYLLPFTGASWYFIGEARPGRLFVLDALPQMLGVVIGFVWLNMTGQLYQFLIALATLTLLGVAFSATVILRDLPNGTRIDWGLRAALRRLGPQRHGVITAGTTSLYVSLPLLTISAFLPGGTPLYAMGDKLFRFGLVAFSPILQVIQGWIPELGRDHVRARARAAAFIGPAAGMVGGAAVTFLAPVVATILSHGKINLELWQSLPFGLMFAIVACTQVIGLACLVSLNASRALATSTVLGALAGLPLIIAAAFTIGIWGVAWAVVASELVVLAYQLRVLAMRLRETEHESQRSAI